MLAVRLAYGYSCTVYPGNAIYSPCLRFVWYNAVQKVTRATSLTIRWKLRLAAIALSVCVAFAIMFGRFHKHNVVVGDLVISHARSVATAPGAPVAGGYMSIRNKGDRAENLLGVSATFSGGASIHTTTMVDGVTKMRALAGGLEIPPGASVDLEPKGYHLMFTDLTDALEKDQMVNVVLHFEVVGDVEVALHVIDGDDDHHSGH